MSMQQALEIARKYVESNKKRFGKATELEIESAVKRVAGTLRGIAGAKRAA